MKDQVKLTPMMQQYKATKDGLPDDVLLLYRLGDFFELFFDDALKAAPILDVALTTRNGIPMCGVLYHTLDASTRTLVDAGYRVAVAEVETEPIAGKLAERVIRRVHGSTGTHPAILVAADTAERLRPCDVERVYEEARYMGEVSEVGELLRESNPAAHAAFFDYHGEYKLALDELVSSVRARGK